MNLLGWPEPDLNPPNPPDAPHISREQALRDVLAVLHSDSADAAYGWNRAQWLDWLWDEVASSHDEPVTIGLLDTDCPSILRYVSTRLQSAVATKVNELAAQMEPDELEEVMA